MQPKATSQQLAAQPPPVAPGEWTGAGEAGPYALAWRRLIRHRGAVLVMIIIAVYIASAVLAPWLPIQSFTEQNRDMLLAPPSAEHWFGTDHLGRDIFARVIHGMRTSLWVVGIALSLALAFGVMTGVAAGYLGRWVDALVMRSFDAILAFPTLLLAIAVTAFLGRGEINAALALAIVGAPRFARLARADVLRERGREYVEAAQTIGVRPLGIMVTHLLPNIMGTILVQATLFVAFAVLVEAALSFLGLGVQVPRPSLGSMLTDGRPYFRAAPWYAIAPGAFLTIFILSVNYFSDKLRDALDPQAHR